MPLLLLLSSIKLVLGCGLGYFLYTSINVVEDPQIAIPLFALTVFLVVWSLSFFVVYGLQLFFLRVKCNVVALSYKQSCVVALFVASSIWMIARDRWTMPIGIIMLAVTIVVIYLITQYDIKKIRY